MTCSTPKVGDQITVFATVIEADHKKCTNMPWRVQVQGTTGQGIWIGSFAVDRIIERSLVVGDKVHCGTIMAIHGVDVWVKRDADGRCWTYNVSDLRRVM